MMCPQECAEYDQSHQNEEPKGKESILAPFHTEVHNLNSPRNSSNVTVDSRLTTKELLTVK